MPKRTLTALLVAAAAVTSASRTSAETVRVSGGSGGEVAIMGVISAVLASKLAAENITVRYEPMNGDYQQALLNGLSAGTAPDLFYANSSASRPVYSAHMALPVESDTSVFSANLVEAFKYHGQVLSVPWDFSTLALHFNKTIFDDAKVPYPTNDDTWTTMEQKLVAVRKALPDVQGLCITPDYARFGAFALATGWQPFGNQGKTVLDDRFRRAFIFYTGLLKSNAAVMATDVGQSWGGGCLVSEVSATAIEGAWILSAIRDGAPNLSFGTVRLPTDPTSGKRGNLIFAGGWTVNATSKVSKAAQRVADLLTSEEAQRWTLEQGIALPSRRSIGDSAWLKGDQPQQNTIRVVYEGLSDDQVLPFEFGDYGQAWLVPITTALNAVLMNESTIDDALATAQEGIDKTESKN